MAFSKPSKVCTYLLSVVFALEDGFVLNWSWCTVSCHLKTYSTVIGSWGGGGGGCIEALTM